MSRVYVEPLLGFEKGTWNSQREARQFTLDMEGDHYGYGYGGKVYYARHLFIIGLSYIHTELKWQYNRSIDSRADDDWKDRVSGRNQFLSGFMGFYWPRQGVSIWIGYGFLNNAIFKMNLDPDGSKQNYKSRGLTFGMGFPLWKNSRIKWNLEFYSAEAYKLSEAGSKSELPAVHNSVTIKDFNHSHIYLYFSIPFSMFRGKRPLSLLLR